MDSKQLVQALLVALLVYVAYTFILNRFFPPRPPAQTTPAGSSAPGAPPVAESPAGSQPGPALAFSAGQSEELLTLGGRDGQERLEVELSPRGAAIRRIHLTERDKKNRFVHKDAADAKRPYELIRPVADRDRERTSFATYQIVVREFDNRSWLLDDLIWGVASHSTDRVDFTSTLHDPAGGGVLRLTKTYEVKRGAPLIELSLGIENLSERTLSVIIGHDGPIGIRRESPQYDMRRVMAAQHKPGANVAIAHPQQRAGLKKSMDAGEAAKLLGADAGDFVWTALTDRYFGVFTRPLGDGAGKLIQRVEGRLGTVASPETDPGDLLARIYTTAVPIPAGGSASQRFEIYAGPKDSDILARVNPEFDDAAKVGYHLTQGIDQTCMCTFQPLPYLMTELLRGIKFVVGNYGIAIIVLVIIVRGLLHPLAVFQQKSMFKMQEAMVRIQPKMNEIKERLADDKVKQQQEMMRLYAEENVNPAASLVAMVPLFIQMPILVALWQGLNTDVHMRLAPFDGWWIKDLSSPDALIHFAQPITIPILGWLPLIGTIFTNVPSLNVLPILMGVSMYLQQKYMPKPQMQAKMDAARAGQHKPGGGMSPEEQLRQQQMIATMMSIMFPFMFYYMPSGLNLYWLSTNVFGIFESLRIRRQIDRDKARRELLGPAANKPRSPGIVARFLKRMAAQYDELQRSADQASGKAPKKTR
ncbi:Membrane protein insertase YidC [Phycisphaerae bacterium RAS1]|nr:Membrane protein insertase YidC [Phycisphaerae bacterium RAS1]